MPAQFARSEDTALWAPLAPTERFADLMRARGSYWLTIVGRLKPDVSRATAQAEMDAVAAALERQYPVNAGIGVRLVPMHEEIVGDVRLPLLILLGAVSFVLLIACANVANLLLTRAAARRQELAIRTALGAGRARIIRQMLTESLVLAVIGGAAGLGLAAWGIAALQWLAPSNVPRLDQIGIDAAVIAVHVAGCDRDGAPVRARACTSEREDTDRRIVEGGKPEWRRRPVRAEDAGRGGHLPGCHRARARDWRRSPGPQLHRDEPGTAWFRPHAMYWRSRSIYRTHATPRTHDGPRSSTISRRACARFPASSPSVSAAPYCSRPCRIPRASQSRVGLPSVVTSGIFRCPTTRSLRERSRHYGFH